MLKGRKVTKKKQNRHTAGGVGLLQKGGDGIFPKIQAGWCHSDKMPPWPSVLGYRPNSMFLASGPHIPPPSLWCLAFLAFSPRMVRNIPVDQTVVLAGPTSSPFSQLLPVSLVTAAAVLVCHCAPPRDWWLHDLPRGRPYADAEVLYASRLQHPQCPSDLLPLTCFLKDSSQHASLFTSLILFTFGSIAERLPLPRSPPGPLPRGLHTVLYLSALYCLTEVSPSAPPDA